MSRLPIQRPVNIATDFNATVFENADINLFDLYVAAVQRGEGQIKGRTFRGCRLQGPAVLLVSAGVHFDDVNFGDAGDDARNLVLRAAGRLALGTLPVRECLFEGCEFYNVGFTGEDAFLDQIIGLGVEGA